MLKNVSVLLLAAVALVGVVDTLEARAAQAPKVNPAATLPVEAAHKRAAPDGGRSSDDEDYRRLGAQAFDASVRLGAIVQR